MGINNVNNYPENYILLGAPGTRLADADILISDMKSSNPETFEGNRDFFTFELR